MGIKPAARYLSRVAAQHIESAYRWSKQPKGLVGDELGLELCPPHPFHAVLSHVALPF